MWSKEDAVQYLIDTIGMLGMFSLEKCWGIDVFGDKKGGGR